MRLGKMKLQKVVPLWIYILFLLVPIYWLVNMSFKTNTEILGGLTLWPQDFTMANYHMIFTDPVWYNGYLNSLYYVCLNTVISLSVALPAAYAFSRYRFLGDKHLFFWLLTNRMAPPAVFLLPFFQLYSSIGLFDTTLAVAWHTVCSTCRWRSGFWKASCPACPRKSTKRRISTATAFPNSS